MKSSTLRARALTDVDLRAMVVHLKRLVPEAQRDLDAFVREQRRRACNARKLEKAAAK